MTEPTLPQVRVGVATIINRGNLVLLIRRRHVHGDGTWSTPGGLLEFNETVEECSARESLEETGLVVEDLQFFALTEDRFPEHNSHYLTVWMRAGAVAGEPTLAAPYESDAIDWYPWDALPEPLFLPFRHLLAGECLPPNALTFK
jgi:8-oxo-dGTP diphosphatase